jgi:hypothetical protein
MKRLHEEFPMPDNDSAAIQVRVSGPLREKLENWRKAQDRVPPLSQALRQLLEKALADERRRTKPTGRGLTKATEAIA